MYAEMIVFVSYKLVEFFLTLGESEMTLIASTSLIPG